jgi:hypothetical protein
VKIVTIQYPIGPVLQHLIGILEAVVTARKNFEAMPMP